MSCFGEVRRKILAHQETWGVPEKLDEDRGEKSVENGIGPRESIGRTSRGHRAKRKAEIEEADDRTSRKGPVGVSEYSGWPRLLGRRVSGWESGQRAAEGLEEADFRREDWSPHVRAP